MEIQTTNYKLPPNFVLGSNRYNLDNSYWRTIPLNSKIHKIMNAYQIQSPSEKLPNITFLNKSIVFFGKRDFEDFEEIEKKQELGNIYSINLLTGQIKQWDIAIRQDSTVPECRIQNGIVEYDGQICIYGGKTFIGPYGECKYHGDLFKFCPYTSQWTLIQSKNQDNKPLPRVPLIFTFISGNFLVFGGYNKKSKLKDCFMLIDGFWVQFSIVTHQPAQYIFDLTGVSFCVHNNQTLYLFGGYNDNKQSFSGELFRFDFNFMAQTLSIIKIPKNQGNLDKRNKEPCPRSHHSMIAIDKNMIAVVGGIGLANQKQYEKLSVMERMRSLKDIAFYNVSKNIWYRICPLNGPITSLKMKPVPQKQILAAFYNHSIYVVSTGLEEKASSSIMVEVEFNEFQIIRPELCGHCSKRIKHEKQFPIDKKSPFLSNGLIYNLALRITFPFEAFGLLADCALELGADQLQIKKKSNEISDETSGELFKNSYIELIFNSKGISNSKYRSLCSHTPVSAQINSNPQLMEKLTIGALRLGKTFLFLNTCFQTGFRRAFFFSVNSLIIHDYQRLYNYMSYQQSISEQYISTKDGILNKKYIINFLGNYINNPQSLLKTSIDGSIILIFDTNIFMNVEHQNYPQLISLPVNRQEGGIRDIYQYKDLNKIEFLQKIGFNLKINPEVSLYRYMSLLYHRRVPGNNNRYLQHIKIQNRAIGEITCIPYQQHLNAILSSNKGTQLVSGTFQVNPELSFKCLLCRTNKIYLQNNYGILIYLDNRLVNRLETNMGDIFLEKFNRTKYKEGNLYNQYQYFGIIEVEKGLKVNLSNNGFVNTPNYQKFYTFVIKLIKDAVTPHYEIQSIVQPEIQPEVQSVIQPQIQQNRQNSEKLKQPVQLENFNIPQKSKKPQKMIINLIEDCSDELQENRIQEQPLQRLEGTKKIKRDRDDE